MELNKNNFKIVIGLLERTVYCFHFTSMEIYSNGAGKLCRKENEMCWHCVQI